MMISTAVSACRPEGWHGDVIMFEKMTTTPENYAMSQ
jgi:hypothetical protein